MLDNLPGSFLYVSPSELALRIACALVAGMVLGLDREIRHRRVGIRTYMLVSIGSAIFAINTMELAAEMAGRNISSDPTRITQGLVGAIGFLGAGAIIQGRSRVGGMATAASIWTAGAVGMAAGLGYYTHSLLTAAIVGLILFSSRFMDHRGMDDRPREERAAEAERD